MIHPTAVVDDGATLGADTKVWHFCHVSQGAKIGNSCSLGQNVYVGNKVKIGHNVKIQNNVSVYDNVTLEDNVFCGPSMRSISIFLLFWETGFWSGQHLARFWSLSIGQSWP